jgi:hypothetical protein
VKAPTATWTAGRQAIDAVLARQRPDRIVYGPNYWQWFEHHRHHGLPPEIAHCTSQLELIRHLGLDVFSRNVYSDQQVGWFGGLCETVWTDVAYEERESRQGSDRVFERVYHTKKGTLTERLRYVFEHSTLVQEKFLVDDPSQGLDAFEELLRGRRWRFLPDRYAAIDGQIGGDGCAIAGEAYSPLKLLHFSMNPIQTCYLLADQPDRAAELMAIHEEASLDLVRQMVAVGVKVIMLMDNLDTMFHPPRLVEQCSASFYERASRICHEHGSHLFIHACGRQKANLGLIASLGIDGLEGVAFPTLGDVELDEAMRLSGDRLILTGGISALEFERLQTRQDVFSYVQDLFNCMKPYAHRFVFSASCNTPFTAPWESIGHFRDAWLEYGGL